MTDVSEWLANISIPYVILTAVILFGVRYLLLKKYSQLAKSAADMAKRDPQGEQRVSNLSQFAKSAAEIVESLLIAILLVFLIIKPFLVQSFFIPSESMTPTLEISDHILVNKLVYRFEDLKRGDIVVFKSPAEADLQEKDFIKRLIGLPGDVLEIRTGAKDKYGVSTPALYRNGERVDEPYLQETMFSYPNPAEHFVIMNRPFKVPPGHLFMMGDNRNNSNDSRFWGPLDRNRVIGKSMFRFWPLNRIGLVH